MEEQYEEHQTTWTTTDGTEIQAQNLEVTREETIETNCELDQSQTSGQQTTTITTVNSGNPQVVSAISNQMAPATQQLLVTTNQFGQQQRKSIKTGWLNQLTDDSVIPVNIEMGQQLGGGAIVGNWGGQNIQQVVYPTMTTVINQSDNSQVQKVSSSGQTQIQVQQLQHTPTNSNKRFSKGASPTKTTTLVQKTPGSTGRKKRQWKSLVLRKLH